MRSSGTTAGGILEGARHLQRGAATLTVKIGEGADVVNSGDRMGGVINLNRGTLISAGQSMKAAGSAAGKANPHEDLAPVAGALPGSQSATAASGLASAWEQRFKSWQRKAHTCGEGMIRVAHNYHHSDEGSKRNADGLRDSLAAMGTSSSVSNRLRERLG